MEAVTRVVSDHLWMSPPSSCAASSGILHEAVLPSRSAGVAGNVGRSVHATEEIVMALDKPVRRMTLRQLMTHAEKCARDLIEQINGTVLPRVSDFRDLSRPVRRRSHFPSMVALLNALNKYQQAGEETRAMTEYLLEQMQEIRERARLERYNRR
jgi:hypothetical protein